MTNVELVTTID